MSGKGAFLCLGTFVMGATFFSGVNFINIRGNQSKIMGKLKNFGGNFKFIGGKCVSGI